MWTAVALLLLLLDSAPAAGPGGAARAGSAGQGELPPSQASAADREPLRLAVARDGVDLELRLEPVPGDLRPRNAPPERAADFADYSRAGRLILRTPVLLGPLPSGDVLVPAGEYAAGFLPGPSGLPALRLVGADGQSVRVGLVAAPVPSVRPAALAAELVPGDASWTLIAHLPTVSGMAVLRAAPPAAPRVAPAAVPPDLAQAPPPAAAAERPPSPEARPSRSERIRRRVEARERDDRERPRRP